MALKDKIALGTLLPHRAPEPIAMSVVRTVAQRAEALGFKDLWVTENTVDHAYSFDPMVVLTYAAAVTSTIRLGVAVVVLPTHSPLHVALQTASLDYVSGGRAILGVGLGRDQEYHDFQVPLERRVRRFREAIEVMKALWTQDVVNYPGEIYHLHDAKMALKPLQKPHPPLWMGGGHPNALKRAVKLGNGWMAGGAQSNESFRKCVALLKEELEKAGRDPATFPISKRVVTMVDEDAQAARSQVNRWFTEVYRNPDLTDSAGVYGTPERVREQLEALREMGATHLVLNSASDYVTQLEALAAVAGG